MRRNIKYCLFAVIFIFVYYFCFNHDAPGSQNTDEQVEHLRDNSTRDPKVYVNSRPRILPDYLCSTPHLLVVIVHSKPSHFQIRKSIRRTWGNRDRMYDLFYDNVGLFFLLGETGDVALQNRINKESKKFQDIIQECFVDSVKNSTIKSLMMLKLANIFCVNSCRYLLKINDDVLANLDNIMQMLESIESPDLLMGEMVCDARPDRNPKSQWYASHHSYPEAKYPNYLSRGAYLMSLKVAKDLYEVALQTPIFHLEDVYITGVCAKKAQIKHQHSDRFTKRKIQLDRDQCLLRELYAVHNVDAVGMQIIYHMLMEDWSEVCSRMAFSGARWIFNAVFEVKGHLFGYRQTCH